MQSNPLYHPIFIYEGLKSEKTSVLLEDLLISRISA